jgi:hypothetical protein
MAKSKEESLSFFEGLVGDVGPRQGFGVPGMMFGRDRNGVPGVQFMGEFIPYSKFKYKAAGGSPKEDDAGVEPGKKIKDADVDFGMGGKQRNLSDVYRPKVTPTMKEGGLVRGAGCAQRGRGRGKMV